MDGNLYRRLASDEYSYSAATGFIALKTAAKTRVAAHYAHAPAELAIDAKPADSSTRRRPIPRMGHRSAAPDIIAATRLRRSETSTLT
jgi:hypothetical protein